MPVASVIKCKFAALATVVLVSACGGSGSGSGDSVSAGALAAGGASDSPGYHSDAKSIIDSRCVTCHSKDSVAPFSLDGYAAVSSKRSALAYSLESGTMPPPGFAALTDAERDLLLRWLGDGAPEGDNTAPRTSTPYTYHGDVRKIIDERCANCHTPGEIAPFSLNDYQSVYAVRAAIAHQVEVGAMPPWPPTRHYMPLKNSRALDEQERAVLMSWLQGGAPEGNPNDYVAEGSEPPAIDYNLTVTLNEPYTPTEIPDEYRCLVMDWPLEETVYVDAVAMVPDAREEVHHVIAVVVDPEKLGPILEADGADGKPGFPCWGAPSPEGNLVPPRTLTVWAPGMTAGYLPEGTGVRIDPGSKIVMQMHYNTSNTDPVPDQSSINIHYVESVEREAVTLFFLNVDWYGAGGMPIPADDPHVTHQHTGHFGFLMGFSDAGSVGVSEDEPFAIHSTFMHQHVLGKSTSIELLREDGTELMLVDIRDWDFDWQDEYVFEEEVIMYPEDRLRLTCTWDNSAPKQQFVDGKQLEPRYVEFGEGTYDEMCVNYFYVTRAKPADLESYQDFPPTVAFSQPAAGQVFAPGDYVPIELLINALQLQEPSAGHVLHGHSDTGEHAKRHRTGHYHLYIDSEDDSADHLTRWDSSTFYQLPGDITPGEHTFRVSLRDDNHEPLGVESRVTIKVEDVAANQDQRRESLVDVNAWQPRAETDDVLASHRPDQVNCSPNAWYEEDGALEVETGYCNYLSLVQASQVAVNSGDMLHLVLWHGQLNNAEPAEAHVAVSIAGQRVFEWEVDIPSKGGIYDVVVPSPVTVAVGDEVEFHLHNHGYNNWTLLSLEAKL